MSKQSITCKYCGYAGYLEPAKCPVCGTQFGSNHMRLLAIIILAAATLVLMLWAMRVLEVARR